MILNLKYVFQKELLETGEVNRQCATQEYCDNIEQDDTKSCCQHSQCNSAISLSTNKILILIGLVHALTKHFGRFLDPV